MSVNDTDAGSEGGGAAASFFPCVFVASSLAIVVVAFRIASHTAALAFAASAMASVALAVATVTATVLARRADIEASRERDDEGAEVWVTDRRAAAARSRVLRRVASACDLALSALLNDAILRASLMAAAVGSVFDDDVVVSDVSFATLPLDGWLDLLFLGIVVRVFAAFDDA